MNKLLAYASLCSCAVIPSLALAETLYVPTVHVLQTNGEYKAYALAGTEGGVSRVECEMRADAWQNEHADTIAIAKKTLSESGKYGDMRVNCERKK